MKHNDNDNTIFIPMWGIGLVFLSLFLFITCSPTFSAGAKFIMVVLLVLAAVGLLIKCSVSIIQK